MTETTDRDEVTPAVAEKLLRSEDHDRGLQDVRAVVADVSRPTPHVLRVTLRLPPRAAADPAWATPNVAVRLDLGPAQDHASRVYTVRSHDPRNATVELDVVLHGHPSPMMSWASRVREGDELGFRGPRPHFLVPGDPARPAALFLDETAIPALYAILRRWPVGRRALGWVATSDAAAFDELSPPPGVVLERIEPSEDGSAMPLAERAAALARPASYAVWGAGERDEMRAIRRCYRTGAGMAKEDVAVYGYWKRGVTNTEIDERRLVHYRRLVDAGRTLEDVDDLSIGI